MVRVCLICGESLSTLERVGGVCSDCKARRKAEIAQTRTDAKQERKQRAERGTASGNELEMLKQDGHLVVSNRIVRCPICDHDRFDQKEVLLNSRGASFFNLDWLDAGAKAHICQRCRHILWFA